MPSFLRIIQRLFTDTPITKKRGDAVYRLVRISILFLLSLQLLSAQDLITDEVLIKGLAELKGGNIENAASTFRAVLADASMKPFHPDALYWLVKTDIALRQYDEASRAADSYLTEFRSHEYFEEIQYQRARLLYLEDEPDQAIIALGNFISEYTDSVFISSAYYWIGESLVTLGRLEEADAVFSELLESFPAGIKREAARYRRSEISLLYRERELLDLLKWSHEEYLQDAEDFYRRESEYADAVAEYRNKLGGDTQFEMQRLYTNRLLDSKKKLLTLQEYYVDELLRLSDAR